MSSNNMSYEKGKSRTRDSEKEHLIKEETLWQKYNDMMRGLVNRASWAEGGTNTKALTHTHVLGMSQAQQGGRSR